MDEPPATTLPDAPEEEDDPNLQSASPASLSMLLLLSARTSCEPNP
jgi:hypothetical protein